MSRSWELGRGELVEGGVQGEGDEGRRRAGTRAWRQERAQDFQRTADAHEH